MTQLECATEVPVLISSAAGAKMYCCPEAIWNRWKRDDPDFPKSVTVGPGEVEYYDPKSIEAYWHLRIEKHKARLHAEKSE